MKQTYNYAGFTIEPVPDKLCWRIVDEEGNEFGTAQSVSKAQHIIRQHRLEQDRRRREGLPITGGSG